MAETRGGGRGARSGRGRVPKLTESAEGVTAENPPAEPEIPMEVAEEVEVGKSDDPKMPPPDDQECFLTAVTPKEISDDSCRTFIFKNEGHTLGNSLRCVITHYPEVKFCGHTIPHPSENEMHLRIQTTGVPAINILRRGLTDLAELCEHTETKFSVLVEEYKVANPGCEIEIPEPTLASILGL